MVDNQHQQITGYRDLSEAEIKDMNTVKNIGEVLKELVDELNQQDNTDKRWVAIGKTQLQQGIMALVRSIAQPDSF